MWTRNRTLRIQDGGEGDEVARDVALKFTKQKVCDATVVVDDEPHGSLQTRRQQL